MLPFLQGLMFSKAGEIIISNQTNICRTNFMFAFFCFVFKKNHCFLLFLKCPFLFNAALQWLFGEDFDVLTVARHLPPIVSGTNSRAEAAHVYVHV